MFDEKEQQTIKNSNVVFMVPCYGGAVFEKFFTSFVRAVISHKSNYLKFGLETLSNESLITRARNTLVAKGMVSRPSNCVPTHLMFIDADVGFEVQDIYQLIADDKDIVAGAYPKKAYPIEYAYNKLPEDPPIDENGLVKVKHAGTGFMMIKRDVIRRMFEHYPELKYKNDLNIDMKYEPHLYALFDTGIDEDKTYLSEDYMFCNRWRAMGGDIWVDTKIRLSHSGYHSFQG